jgi:hypothetical protein
MAARGRGRQRKVTVMSTKARGILRVAGLLGSVLLGATPVLAQSHGGGHAGGGGGGHAVAGGHSGGFAHAPAGAHFGGAPHYAAAGHYAGTTGYAHSYPAGYRGAAYGGNHGVYGHAGYYGHSGYYGHGYSTGAYWHGGYWHGGFWPRCYYGVGFAWFLPILPVAYATYWYGGVPYYYANDVYYTYNPSYEGYVATDPPPVADPNAGGGADAAQGGAPPMAPNGQPGPNDGAVGQIFMYPKNGQSAEQQATDKAECQQWAAQQAGQAAQNGSDYQRAMTACVEGRGYSAR